MAYGVCENLGDMWFLDNKFDIATLTATSMPGLGSERLRDPRLGKIWRSPTTGADLTISFASAIPLQCFAIFGVQPINNTMTLSIGTTPGGSDIRSGAWAPTINKYAKQAFWLNAVERPGLAAPSVREIRLTSVQQLQLGRVWAGDYHWTPVVNMAPNSANSVVDLSSVQRTKRGGAVLADAAAVQRVVQINYDSVSADEASDELFTLDMEAGVHQQILFIPNYKVYAVAKYGLLGYQDTINPIALLGADHNSRSYVLREAG